MGVFRGDGVVPAQQPGGTALRRTAGEKHGKAKALSILAARLGRAVYCILQGRAPFDSAKFLARA
jgi:hypothetical protein